MRSWVGIATATTTFVLGTWVGWTWAPSTATTVVELEAPAPALACLRAPPGLEGQLASREALRARWCEASLDGMRRRLNGPRLPWPEELGTVHPERFLESINRLATACGGEVEATECTEYPCVAVVKADHPRRLADDCGGDTDATAGIHFDVEVLRCPDGRKLPVALAFGTGGEDLWNAQIDQISDTDQGMDLGAHARLWGRRIDDALSMVSHLCD